MLIFMLFVSFLSDVYVSASIRRPVIGILSQPTDDQSENQYSYIAASYVKWVESGGGLPYGIPFDLSEEKHEEIFKKINGVLLPGGDQDLKLGSKFMNTQKKYFDLSLGKDTFFPIFGTCMGFQSLLILATNDDSVLETGFDSYNLSLPLDNLNKSSRTMRSLPAEIVNFFSDQPVTMNQHHDGIMYDSFLNDSRLMDFYDIVSTNRDRKGKEFVSTMEAKSHPIIGVQYHPEKVMFEINPDALDVSLDSVLANLALSALFVEQARRNSHRLDDLNELIFNLQPTFTDDYFLQRYYYAKQGKAEDVGKKCSAYCIILFIGSVVLALAVFVCLSFCCVCLDRFRGIFVKDGEEKNGDDENNNGMERARLIREEDNKVKKKNSKNL